MASVYCTANGIPVVSAKLTFPRIGTWVADLLVDTEQGLASSVVLEVGGLTLNGSVWRSGVAITRTQARVVGGARGLGATLKPRFYRQVPARIVLNDLLSEAGEKLAPSSDPALLSRTLAAWARFEAPASDCLRALVDDELVASWRVLPDGSVWVGAEQWPETSAPYTVISERPELGQVEIGCSGTLVLPGTTIGGRRVSHAIYVVDGENLRGTLSLDTRSDDGDRIRVALDAIVRQRTAWTVYLGQFPAAILAQNSDGTLELKPEDTRLPGLSRVPIRYGIPGVVAKVAAGGRVLVGFENGDPSRPVAELWDSASLVELSFAGGTKPVARSGDTVDLGTFVVAGSATLTWTPPGGGPPQTGTVIATGSIKGGAEKVKA
jgi:hypothetical protein